MNIEQLKTLDTIVKNGSFRNASKVLHKAQSAVSVSIKNLEEYIGFSLFDRDGYRPVLTEKGKIFYESSKNILQKMDELVDLSKTIEHGLETEINISVSFTTEIKGLPEILKVFSDKYPGTNILLKVSTMDTSIEELKSGAADIAFATNSEPVDEFESIEWRSTTIVNVIGSSNKLAASIEDISFDDLKTVPQIVVSSQSDPKKGKSAGILEGGKHWVVSDFETKKYLIKEGLGWGGIPMYMVKKDLTEGTILNLKKLREPVTFTSKAFRKRKTLHGEASEYLWALIKSKNN
ncbi:LysR family transcriptional regulator [bacterium]|nr:LysR family transcriptional regulator [bacterium]